jgi:hypothetical protein
MKNWKLLVGLSMIGFLLFLSVSCGISTEDLAKQVQANYVSNWKEQEIPITITKDLVLVKKSNTEYTGLMTVSAYGETEQVTVNVVVDGKHFVSQIEDW